jgi:hypothetical protein
MTATGADVATDELIEIAHIEGSYVAGRMRNVGLFYWMTAGTLSGVDALNELCEELSHGRKQPFSAIHVMRQRLGLPDADVRQALAASMKKYADVTCCLGIITLGAGFWVSALQGAVTGIRMLAPVGSSLLRFVQRPEDLRGWFVSEHATRTGQKLDEPRVLAGVQQLLELGDGASAVPFTP